MEEQRENSVMTPPDFSGPREGNKREWYLCTWQVFTTREAAWQPYLLSASKRSHSDPEGRSGTFHITSAPTWLSKPAVLLSRYSQMMSDVFLILCKRIAALNCIPQEKTGGIIDRFYWLVSLLITSIPDARPSLPGCCYGSSLYTMT